MFVLSSLIFSSVKVFCGDQRGVRGVSLNDTTSKKSRDACSAVNLMMQHPGVPGPQLRTSRCFHWP